MNERESYMNYCLLDKQWMELENLGGNINSFFKERNIKTIAVYGIGSLTNRLIDELQEFNINILYLISSSQINIYKGISVYDIDEELPEVDIIVITEIDNYLKVERELCEKNIIEVISIQELVDKTLRNIKKD